MQKKWSLNLATALLWALAAASAMYWGLRMSGLSAAASVPGSAAFLSPDASPAARQASIAGLLGAQPETIRPSAGAAERFTLAGVIASAVGEGVALISIDGKPARPYAVGAQLEPGFVLKSVGRREAMLADGANAPVSATLSLPVQQSSSAPGPALAALPAVVPAATVSAAAPAGTASAAAGVAATPAQQADAPSPPTPTPAPAQPQAAAAADRRGPAHGP